MRLIDADALINEMYHCPSDYTFGSKYRKVYEYGRDEMFYHAIESIKKAPTIEPAHGHWEWNQRTGEYECSECGCNPIYERTTHDVSEIDKYRYCRWCGAPMEVHDGKENS